MGAGRAGRRVSISPMQNRLFLYLTKNREKKRLKGCPATLSRGVTLKDAPPVGAVLPQVKLHDGFIYFPILDV